MKFVIDRNPTVRWPVVVRMPANGAIEKRRFHATFRVLPESEHDVLEAKALALMEGIRKGEKTAADLLAHNLAELPQVVVELHDVADDQGRPVLASELPELLRGPHGKALAHGLSAAMAQIWHGIPPDAEEEEAPGASAGNSAPSPAAG